MKWKNVTAEKPPINKEVIFRSFIGTEFKGRMSADGTIFRTGDQAFSNRSTALYLMRDWAEIEIEEEEKEM